MKTRKFRKHTLAMAVCVALAGNSFEVMADEAAIMAELKAMKQKIEQLENELRESREASEEADAKLERAVVDATEEAKSQDKVLFEADEASPKLLSKDGTKSIEIHGRAFIDIASLPDMYKYGEVEDFYAATTKSEFRKLYLGIEGQFAKDWEYELTIDFAEQDVDLKDANVTYLGWNRQELVLGYQKPSFMLENTSSSKYTMFMTRGLTDSFSDERALGANWKVAPSWGSVAVGGFVPNSFIDGKLKDHTEGETESGDELIPSEDSSEIDRYGLIGRATWAPIASDSRLVHLGVSGMYASYDEPSTVKLRARPGAHLAERLVYAKVKKADNSWTAGLEAAFIYDNFTVQSEYIQSSISAKDDYSFSGYFVAGSWLLTGESHMYKKESGKFKGVNPRRSVSDGGWGAWELAARYGSIDLNDKKIYGGKMNSLTLGVNWYMEQNLRAMLNYVHYEADSYEDDDDYVLSQDGNIIEGRLAFYF